MQEAAQIYGQKRGSTSLQVASTPLFFFDRYKQRLEVSLAETLASFPLQDLVKDRRPVLDRLGEDLQEIAFFVAVDEDAESLEVFDVLVNLADLLGDFLVVGVRHTKELNAVCL